MLWNRSSVPGMCRILLAGTEDSDSPREIGILEEFLDYLKLSKRFVMKASISQLFNISPKRPSPLEMVKQANKAEVAPAIRWGPLITLESVFISESLLTGPSNMFQDWRIAQVKEIGASFQINPILDSWEMENVSESAGITPGWLWDTETEKTVTVVPGSEALYTAISYTWGRYRRKMKLDTGGEIRCWKRLPGVEWPVPLLEHGMFTPEQLIQTIKKLSCTRYVWIDIFCIPQENNRDAERREEVAKQGGIFGNAVSVVAWLWDLPNARPLQLFMTGLTIALHLRNTWPDDPNTKALEAMASRLDSSLALSGRDPFSCSWFSSLWTLQELILAPHMRICAFDGSTTVNTRGDVCSPKMLGHAFRLYILLSRAKGRTSIGLDFAEVGSMEDRYLKYGCTRGHLVQIMPSFVTQLDALLNTSIPAMTSHSRPDYLNASSLRQATSRRGEAIMSAVGCLEWYNAISASQKKTNIRWIWKSEPCLHEVRVEEASRPTRDRYVEKTNSPSLEERTMPAALFSELAKKIGVNFFFNVPILAHLPAPVDLSSSRPKTLVPYSMLPYTAVRDGGDRSEYPSRWEADCSTWTIGKDLNVTLPKNLVILDLPLVKEHEKWGTSRGVRIDSMALHGGLQRFNDISSVITAVRSISECDSVIFVPMKHLDLDNLRMAERFENILGIILTHNSSSQSTGSGIRKYHNYGSFGFHFIRDDLQRICTVMGEEIQAGYWGP